MFAAVIDESQNSTVLALKCFSFTGSPNGAPDHCISLHQASSRVKAERVHVKSVWTMPGRDMHHFCSPSVGLNLAA